MIIPDDPGERDSFYKDILGQCLVSREHRKRRYGELKRYYMYGCGANGDPGQTVNQIYPHIDQLVSFMYSQETTRFATGINATVSDGQLAMVPTINQEINDSWHDSNADTIFGSALTWAFVYGSMFIKKRWNGHAIENFSVEPHNFGVFREDVPMLDRQEAFVHCYLSTKSQLERELKLANNKQINEIMTHVVKNGAPLGLQGMQVGNIVISATTPQVIGNVDINLSSMGEYIPRVNSPLIRMYELYVYNDAIKDFQIVTIADPSILVYDRPLSDSFVENERPFIQICPQPSLDYFWGYSEVERLLSLQDMRNERLAQVRKMMNRQADPPKAYSGFMVSDETDTAFDTPGGMIASDIPGAKVELMTPDIPEDLFREIDKIDAMFEVMSGITNVLAGRGETGVRSTGHASQLAKLGASRAKRKALIIEDSLEKSATLDLQIQQKYSKKQYKDKDGAIFILDQFTKDFIVKVDAHSSSPIFMEDTQQLIFELFKVKAIDREELLLMLDVPLRQLLLQKLKQVIEPAEAKAAQEERVLQLHGVASKKK